MTRRPGWIILLTIAVAIAGAASSADAIPAFARKYKTSCETCHTVFPKLTPFGEAFRRNGYRFPGVDSDFMKMEAVPLGQDAFKKMFPDAVWPGSLPGSAPFALGFNGSAIVHPQSSASAAVADGGARFTMNDLVEEGHLWAGGSLDDSITFFSELTASGGGIELEHATLQFSDLAGPAHLINVWAGKGQANLGSFGPHSSYVADTRMPLVPVTALYGATTDSFDLIDNYPGVEINGVAAGRVDYSLGLNAGPDIAVRNSQDIHAHVGVKLGGMRLDGEDTGDTPQDPNDEHAVTLDAFWVRASSQVTDAAMNPETDTAIAVGGSLRGQWGVFELDAGGYYQTDSHAVAGGDKVTSVVEWDELSWRAYPWLVGAARVEYQQHKPSAGTQVNDLRITPGVAALVRPNLKLTLTAPIERAHGAPDGGWSPSGGFAAPATATDNVKPEIEAVQLTLWCAF